MGDWLSEIILGAIYRLWVGLVRQVTGFEDFCPKIFVNMPRAKGEERIKSCEEITHFICTVFKSHYSGHLTTETRPYETLWNIMLRTNTEAATNWAGQRGGSDSGLDSLCGVSASYFKSGSFYSVAWSFFHGEFSQQLQWEQHETNDSWCVLESEAPSDMPLFNGSVVCSCLLIHACYWSIRVQLMTFRGKFMISKALVTLETLEHQGFYSNTVALEYAPNSHATPV